MYYCPKCVTEETRVSKTHKRRKYSPGNIVMRDRVCKTCGYAFTTWETQSDPQKTKQSIEKIEKNLQHLRENTDASP